MKHIDITPTWRQLIPLLVEVAANGVTPEGRKEALTELYRLADYADTVIAERKTIKEED